MILSLMLGSAMDGSSCLELDAYAHAVLHYFKGSTYHLTWKWGIRHLLQSGGMRPQQLIGYPAKCLGSMLFSGSMLPGRVLRELPDVEISFGPVSLNQ
ncbi:hypothetical protein AXG93_2175s1760 [Marchantia polymorpha subsp. ruderalis]|uniref:Uncharacterized protein n=1 Tax=Marchantia polymorpha subsp. ruderalis TaxID=1480154 RepID=A0A176W7Z5_MARPO|nr:hypothetical protein AXG93_2175s1760 [Marchantia polymorpha subsp. ruderalis]